MTFWKVRKCGNPCMKSYNSVFAEAVESGCRRTGTVLPDCSDCSRKSLSACSVFGPSNRTGFSLCALKKRAGREVSSSEESSSGTSFSSTSIFAHVTALDDLCTFVDAFLSISIANSAKFCSNCSQSRPHSRVPAVE